MRDVAIDARLALRVTHELGAELTSRNVLRGTGTALLGLLALSAIPAGASAASEAPAPNSSAGLPGGRAYEKVSPDDKGGFGIERVGQPGADGLVAYTSFGAFAGQPSGAYNSPYVGRRGPAAWATEAKGVPSPAPPPPLTPSAPVRWSADLATQIVSSPFSLAGGAPDYSLNGPYSPYFYQNANLYRRGPNGQFELVSAAESDIPPAERTAFQAVATGSSADLSTVIFQANASLTPGAPAASQAPAGNIYARSAAGLENVGILPGETVAPSGAIQADRPIGNTPQGLAENAVSSSGARVYFQASPSAGEPNQLYLRSGVGASTKQTVLVSRSRRATPDARVAPQFQAATADGASAVFISRERLTDDATPPAPLGNEGGDLYRYDASSDTLTDLTVADPSGARVEQVVGVSEDLSVIYVIARGVLVSGGTAGAVNLYRLSGSGTTFVAKLDESDMQMVTPANRQVMATSDGETLVFQSRARLTSDDNRDPDTSAPHAQMYLYEASGDSLACISCRAGARPKYDAQFPKANISYFPSGVQAMTADGRLVFFETANNLTPGAASQHIKVFALDRSTNSVSMISRGASSGDDHFVGTSPDGRDAYFTTADALVEDDKDNVDDLYDARVGGGYPTSRPTEPCAADACQGPLSGSPVLPSIGSVAFGPGNVTPEVVPPVRHGVRARKSASVRGTNARVSARVTGAGYISASGSGLRTTKRTVAKAGTYGLRLRLSSKGLATQRKRGSVRVKVRIRFAPIGAAARSATVSVTFKKAKARVGSKGASK
ncbi:hypothetical protein [Patulibacter defluvii]|uniref:hypothetical protein n=1 Tax=Patulibacter defluvii TaxID=3095358 RepID=UPI002A75667E|nr:hypothetical protein [Patulibacter sp. DM4]